MVRGWHIFERSLHLKCCSYGFDLSSHHVRSLFIHVCSWFVNNLKSLSIESLLVCVISVKVTYTFAPGADSILLINLNKFIKWAGTSIPLVWWLTQQSRLEIASSHLSPAKTRTYQKVKWRWLSNLGEMCPEVIRLRLLRKRKYLNQLSTFLMC